MPEPTELRYCRNCGVPSTDRCDPLCWCVSTLQGCEGCLTATDLEFKEMVLRLSESESLLSHPYSLDVWWPGDPRYWECINTACKSRGLRRWWWLWKAERIRRRAR